MKSARLRARLLGDDLETRALTRFFGSVYFSLQLTSVVQEGRKMAVWDVPIVSVSVHRTPLQRPNTYN